MSELLHCLISLGVLEVFWFYATLIIFIDNNNNNKNGDKFHYHAMQILTVLVTDTLRRLKWCVVVTIGVCLQQCAVV